MTNDTKAENRITQILAEIGSLKESLTFNYDKLSFVLSREFSKGNAIKVSGKGSFNGMVWSFDEADVHSNLIFEDNVILFSDCQKNIYVIKCENITKVSITEAEDGISN